MFSIVARQLVSICITKTEELVLRPRMIFQRTVHTSNILSTRMGHKNRIKKIDLTEEFNLFKDPQDFGKVVEFELEDLQGEQADNWPLGKKRQKKNVSKANTDDNLNTESESDEIEKKPKFVDLRRKSTDSFSSIMIQLKTRKGREKTNQIFLEGKRLIQDAVKVGQIPSKVYFSRLSDLKMINLPEGVEVYRIPYKKLQFWSDVVTSQGVIGIFQKPDLSILNKTNSRSIPLTVICDNIREPNNLGSILRVVASVGCEKLILTKGCVDIWEPKVLRCAAGAHFHLPVLKDISWAEMGQEITEDCNVVLASCDSKAEETKTEDNSEKVTKRQTHMFATSNAISESLPLKPYSSVDYRNQNTAIVIGGETHGLSTEAFQFAIKRKGVRVYIPMSNEIESLNNAVALGILSYMVRYQLESSVNSSFVGQENNNTTEVN